MEPKQQRLSDLPAELLKQPRFFRVGADKVPSIKGWNKPQNQQLFSKLNYQQNLLGFDICGHDRAEDYALLDLDHVLDDNGKFVNNDAEYWYNQIKNMLGDCYCEKSISGHGLHFLLKPTAEKFKPIANGQNAILCFDKEKNAKLEIFFKNKGRYCLLTGDVFGCAAKTPIVTGKNADDALQAILDEIAKRNQTTNNTNTVKSSQKKKKEHVALGNDYDLFRAEIMLETIIPAELSDSDWLAVMTAAKNIGIAYSIVDSFNQRDSQRYNAKENLKRWDSLNDSSFTIETLHGIAKNFGYSEATTRRDWMKKYGRNKEIKERKQEKLSRLQSEPKKNIAEIQAEIRAMCHWNKDRNGDPTTIKGASFENHKLIFDNDPNLKKLFGRDDFRQETVFFRRAPWHSPNAPLKDSWDDTDDAELRMYLRENYAEMSHPQTTYDFLIRAARENSFHSIRRLLDSLPKWNGTPKAANIFIDFLGAEDTEYVREVTMNFLLGAIARALYPGCDFQSVVVLQGAQGIGKSRVVRMLGGKHGVNPKGDNWHIALRDQLDDSHAVDAMRKGWIVEIEEFAAGSRADVNAMKGVLSADDITRRFAYERRAKTIKAHWVFIATCNDEAPLRDQTGARRFLPIKCHNKECTIVEGMTPEYIQQVWAEAYYKFKQMFPTTDSFDADKLRLTPEIQKQAAEFAKGITQDDGLTTEIKGFIDRKILPFFIWILLTKEERRKFFVEGCLHMIDAVTELNHRRRAIGGNPNIVQSDIDKISDWLDGVDSNNYVRSNKITRGEDTFTEYFVYGSEQRTRICASEIFNECFGSDNRKRITRISEILSQLEGWHLGMRLRNADPIYQDQKAPYYRD